MSDSAGGSPSVATDGQRVSVGVAHRQHRRARSAPDGRGGADDGLLQGGHARGGRGEGARDAAHLLEGVVEAFAGLLDLAHVAGDGVAHPVDVAGQAAELVLRAHRDVGRVVAAGDARHATLEPCDRSLDEALDEEDHRDGHHEHQEDRDERDDEDVGALIADELRERHLDADVAGERAAGVVHGHEGAGHRRRGAAADRCVVDGPVRRPGDGQAGLQPGVGGGAATAVGAQLLRRGWTPG